ncbi:GNAT family N-acetyltransferase [Streptomyces buecherae]|uniref:GNAT family N-acetyltransferase n=1 Tax=Streptomyces buecherae TaxID=2763006 RepID=UPI003678C729
MTAAPDGQLRYAIRLRGRLTDRVGLVPVDAPRHDTGYWLDAAHTGSGYATAACAALHAHATRALGAADVYAGATHGDAARVAPLTRLGFAAVAEPVAEFAHHPRLHRALPLA